VDTFILSKGPDWCTLSYFLTFPAWWTLLYFKVPGWWTLSYFQCLDCSTLTATRNGYCLWPKALKKSLFDILPRGSLACMKVDVEIRFVDSYRHESALCHSICFLAKTDDRPNLAAVCNLPTRQRINGAAVTHVHYGAVVQK
jgi:hypothetical protein